MLLMGGLESILNKQLGFFKELVPNLTRLAYIGRADSAPEERTAMQRASE
jgi:hypothetical protein